jgi:peptide chain release factor 2
MKVLKAKLFTLKEEELAREKQQLRGEFKSAEWGSQIRSYVLQPYKLVKDHRTGYETADADSVLEGNLDGFIEAYLRGQVTGVATKLNEDV